MPGARIGSDHAMVLAKFKLKLQSCPKRRFTPRPNVLALNQEPKRSEFQLDLSNRFAALTLSDDLDAEWNGVKSAVTAAVSSVCPPVRVRKKPWISDTTLQLVDERKVTNSSVRRNALNRQIKAALKVDEDLWWREKADVMEEAARRGDTKTLYQTLKYITRAKTGLNESVKDEHGVFIKTKAEKIERWACYFEQLLNRPDPTELDEELFEDAVDEEIALMRDTAPTLDEVKSAIKHLKRSKSPGIDDITPEALINAGDTVSVRIHRLIQLVWHAERLPQDWKDTIIVPVHKKGM